MTTFVLKTKISEAENKIPDASNLGTKIVSKTKISEFRNQRE